MAKVITRLAKLRSLIARAGTEKETAERLGVSRSTLSKWKSGRHRVPKAAIDMLTRLKVGAK